MGYTLKHIGYSLNEKQPPACLVLNPITFDYYESGSMSVSFRIGVQSVPLFQ